jgi:hypothetical protein
VAAIALKHNANVPKDPDRRSAEDRKALSDSAPKPAS